jgi:uncharacterized protein DUF5753
MMSANDGGIGMTMMMRQPESTVRVEVLGAEPRRVSRSGRDDAAGVVFVGCGTSSLFLEEPDDIEHYKAVTVELPRLAITPRESVELAASIAAALE